MKTPHKKLDRVTINSMDEDMKTALGIFGNVIKGQPELTMRKAVEKNGDMAFSVPLCDLVGNAGPAELRHLLKHRFWCDFIGEVILRRRIVEIMDWIADRPEYDIRAEYRHHRHFGVGIDGDDVIFTLYASKLSEIINDNMAVLLED